MIINKTRIVFFKEWNGNFDEYEPVRWEDDDKRLNILFRTGPNHTCEIVDVCIAGDEEDASKYVEQSECRKGFGSKNYPQWEKLMKEKYGVKNVYAFTRDVNVGAIKWYEKMGFHRADLTDFYHDSGAVCMSKRIPEHTVRRMEKSGNTWYEQLG